MKQTCKERKEERATPVVKGGAAAAIYDMQGDNANAYPSLVMVHTELPELPELSVMYKVDRMDGAVGKTFVLKLERYRFSL